MGVYSVGSSGADCKSAVTDSGGATPSTPTMNDKLYSYLEKIFYRDNMRKYHKYFSMWIENLTQNQILGFQHIMEVDELGLLK